MKITDNPEIQKQIDSLAKVLHNVADGIASLKAVASEGEGTVDTPKEVNDEIFRLRTILFKSKLELDFIQKKINEHISKMLNPEYYQAKEEAKAKKASARKKKDVPDANLGPFEPSRMDIEPFKHITINIKKDGF